MVMKWLSQLVLLLIAAVLLNAVQAKKEKQTDVSEEECPHRLVPLSWDKDRTTIDWRITLTLVFGGNRGLLVRGYEECDAVIAKWKDDINKHTNCRIDGMEVSENGEDWSEMDHSGFYLDREVGQEKVGNTRASITYLKVNEEELHFMPNAYFGKYFRLSTTDCGTFDAEGCLLFKIEEDDEHIADQCSSGVQECGSKDCSGKSGSKGEVEGEEECGSKSKCSGKSGSKGEGEGEEDCGSKSKCSGKSGSKGEGDEEEDSGGNGKNGGSNKGKNRAGDGDTDDDFSDDDEDGDGGESNGDGDDEGLNVNGADPDGDRGTDNESDINDVDGREDADDDNGNDPVGSSTSSVIDPGNGNGDSGGADSSLAPAAAVAAVLTLLAVLVIGGIVAALAIFRRMRRSSSGLNSRKSDEFANPDYGEVDGGGKKAYPNPVYGETAASGKKAFTNPTYGDIIVPSNPGASSDPVYSSIDTPYDDEENIYSEI